MGYNILTSTVKPSLSDTYFSLNLKITIKRAHAEINLENIHLE